MIAALLNLSVSGLCGAIDNGTQEISQTGVQAVNALPDFEERLLRDPKTGSSIDRLYFNEPKDALIGNREALLYGSPSLSGNPLGTLPKGTTVKLTDYAGYEGPFFIYKVFAQDETGFTLTGYTRSDNVIYLDGAVEENGFITIPGGFSGYEPCGCNIMLYGYWLLTPQDEYQFIGSDYVYCGTDRNYWSPGKEYFYTNLIDSSGKPRSRIISKSGETIFDTEHKLDSPYWVSESVLYLRESYYDDDVYRYNTDSKQLDFILTYPGESTIPEAGGGDCWTPNIPVTYDYENKQITATFMRWSRDFDPDGAYGSVCAKITITADEAGNPIDTKIEVGEEFCE